MADLVAEGVPIYVTQHGRAKAVLLKYEAYETLLEKLDDLEDALAMALAQASPEEEAMTLEEHDQQRAYQIHREAQKSSSSARA
jgi:prevent-host-death family protein